jgi:hypothetical protein
MGYERIVKTGDNSERGAGILQADLILGVYGGRFETIKNEEDDIVIGVNLPLIPTESGDLNMANSGIEVEK